MKTMTWLEVKLSAHAGLAALLLGGATTAALCESGAESGKAGEIIRKSREAYAALSSYSDSGTVVSEMGTQTNKLSFKTRLQKPNQYRIDWTQATGVKGSVWSDGNGDYFLAPAAGATPQKMPNLKSALSTAAGGSWSASTTIPDAFFNREIGDIFIGPLFSGRCPLVREKDQKVGGVDCYVVSGELDLSKLPNAEKPGSETATLWIGEQDF